jgi:CubicO group peptidase (beta-lactamase class C family)
MKRRAAITLVCCGLSWPSSGGEADRRSRVLNNLRVIDFSIPKQTGESAALAKRMEYYKTPGVSIAVIDDNAIEWSAGFGLLKAGEPAPVTEASIFQAGSVSKYVTAILVLHFVERGFLDLDADVNRYLKSWKVPESELTKHEKVTLRRLLSHQAGIQSVKNVTQEDGGPEATLAQVLAGEKPALNPPAVPVREPGSQWEYSNLGYAIIQLVLEDVTGRQLPQIAEEVLFRPLDMDRSSFAYPLRSDLQKHEAWPHGSDGQARKPEMDGSARSMGGLATTPEDLAKLTLEVMKAYQGRSTKVVSQKTARLLVTKQVEVPPAALGLPLGNGLGVFLDSSTEEVCFLHPGHNSPGTTFVVLACPALGKGAVIGVNGNVGDRLYLEILASLAVAYDWPVGQPFKR